MKEKDHIVGILVGEGPSSSGSTVVGVFSLPEERRW